MYQQARTSDCRLTSSSSGGSKPSIGSTSTSVEGTTTTQKGAVTVQQNLETSKFNGNEIPKGTDDNSGEDRKLFIGGLSWETKEPQLLEYFSQFGEVESVNLKVDPHSGRSRCFAFLVFKDVAAVSKVIDGREHALSSKKIDVKKAKAKPGKIFVGGVAPELKEESIREHFTKFGAVTEFEMPFDKEKNQRKNFCFVTFEREEVMKDVLKNSKHIIDQLEVEVKKATPRPKSGGGGGSSYGVLDYYGGMDYYYGYNDYNNWYGGGKAHREKSARMNPY